MVGCRVEMLLIFLFFLLTLLIDTEGYYIRRLRDYESPPNPSLLEQIQFFKRPMNVQSLYNRNRDMTRIESINNNDVSRFELT